MARRASTKPIKPTATESIDWRNPDYKAIAKERLERIEFIRNEEVKRPGFLDEVKDYYRENEADFINDWGSTFDPRLPERGLPGVIPMVLFPRQREWIDWCLRRWRSQKGGLTEKSRDAGVSYLTVTLGATLCIFNRGLTMAYTSRKEEYVDKAGQPKSLFWKARLFMKNLPVEFTGSWTEWRDSPHMRISFPDTGSVMTGEVGDQVGRGDRASIYFTDEDAFNPHAESIEHAISQTANCRIRVSTPQGMNNRFALVRWQPREDDDFVFIFDWRQDPRKDDVWYAKQVEDLDPVTVAQEIDRNYNASTEGIVIPAEWVKSSLNALARLGIAPSGAHAIGFDVADEGTDKNAIAGGQGVEVDHLEEWSGKESDLFKTVQRVFMLADSRGVREVKYDADGLGASVRGDSRVINETRAAGKTPEVLFIPYHGSGAIDDPDGHDYSKERTNNDVFKNRKAQEWWRVRRRFMLTHRWVTTGVPCDPADLISINVEKIGLKLAMRLQTELSQPTFSLNNAGKILIDKKPDGMPSPNLADALVIKCSKPGMVPVSMLITDDVLRRARMPPPKRRPFR